MRSGSSASCCCRAGGARGCYMAGGWRPGTEALQPHRKYMSQRVAPDTFVQGPTARLRPSRANQIRFSRSPHLAFNNRLAARDDSVPPPRRSQVVLVEDGARTFGHGHDEAVARPREE
jgi:hypothetical protein